MSPRVNHKARAEDIRWLAETGESLTGAARRLAVGVEGIKKWCRDNGMQAELKALMSRDPIDPNQDDRIQRAAAARWAS